MNSSLLCLLLLFCWSNASQVENHQTFNTTTSSDTDASTTTADLHLIDHSTTASFGEPQSIANETTSSSPGHHEVLSSSISQVVETELTESATSATPATMQIPQFDCLQRADGFYANPSEPCSELYFACVAGSPIPELCPPPLVFEEAPSQSCVWREQLLACLPPHLRHLTQPETSSTPATTTAIRPIFQYECNDTAGNFPDPQRNCSSIFYVCPPSFKFGIRMHCPQSLFFDHQMNWCDSFERIPECSGAPRLVEEQTTPAPQFAPMVHFDCSEKRDGNYPVPDLACPRWFIQCTNGNAFRANCPGNQRYFVDADRCLAPNAVPSCLDPKAIDSSSTSTIAGSEHSTTSLSELEEHPTTVETTTETTSTTAAETLSSVDLQSSSIPFESSSISTPLEESTPSSAFPELTSTTSEVELAESSTVAGEVERTPAPSANNGFFGNDVIRPSTTTTEAIVERETVSGSQLHNSSAVNDATTFPEESTTQASNLNDVGLIGNSGVSTRAIGGFNSSSQMVHFDCSEKRDGNYPVPDLACPRWYIQCTNGNAFRANCPGNQRYFVDADRCLAPNAVPSCLNRKAVDSSSTSTIVGFEHSTTSLFEVEQHPTTVETTIEMTSITAAETTLPSADLQSSSIPFESSSSSAPLEESTPSSSFAELTSTTSEVELTGSSTAAEEIERTPAPSGNNGFIGNDVIRPSTTTTEAIFERETMADSHFDNLSAVNDTTAFPEEPTTQVSILNEEGLSGSNGVSNEAIGGTNSSSQTLSQSEATTGFFEQTTSASEVVSVESSVGALNSTIAIHQSESTVALIGQTTTISEIFGAESTTTFPEELATTTETIIQNDELVIGNRSSSSVGEFISTIAASHRSETTAAFIERTTAARETASTAFPEASTAETIIQSEEGLTGISGALESTGDEFSHGQKATASGLAKPNTAVSQIGNATAENTTAFPAASTAETIIQSDEGLIGNRGALESTGDEFSDGQKATAPRLFRLTTAVSHVGNFTAENTTAFPAASTTPAAEANLTAIIVQDSNFTALLIPHEGGAATNNSISAVTLEKFNSTIVVHQHEVRNVSAESTTVIPEPQRTTDANFTESPFENEAEAGIIGSSGSNLGSNRSSGEFNATILRHNRTTVGHSIQFNTTTATPTTPTPSLFELFDRFGAQAVKALGGRKDVGEAPQPLVQQITTEALSGSDHMTTAQPIGAQHSTANVTSNSSSLVGDEELPRNDTIADNARTSTIIPDRISNNESTLPPFLATSESTAQNPVTESTPHSTDLSADGERLGRGHSTDRSVAAQTDTTAEFSDGRRFTQQQHNATAAPVAEFENSNATTISTAFGTPIGEESSTPVTPNSQIATVA